MRTLRYLCQGILLIIGLSFLSDEALARPYRRNVDERYTRKPDKFYKTGVGFEVGAGNYNGFSFRRMLDKTSYIKSMLGFRLFESQLLGSTDFIMTMPRLFSIIPDLTPYYGAGATIVFINEFESLIGTEDDSGNYFGARIPIGASIKVNLFDLPFSLFAEATPGLLVMPFGRPFFGLTLGILYLF